MTHYNLYYLLLEDAQKNPMPILRAQEIKDFLEEYYCKTKALWENLPLLSEAPKES